MKTAVVPLPSLRCTAVIGAAGIFAPPLASAIFGSDQSLICPENMPAMSSGVSFSGSGAPFTL